MRGRTWRAWAACGVVGCMALTGCGGSSASESTAPSSASESTAPISDSGFTSAESVVDGLASNSFPCKEDGSPPSTEPVIVDLPDGGGSIEVGTRITCDAYVVDFHPDMAAAEQAFKAFCPQFRAVDWQYFDEQVNVRGSNYLVYVNFDEDGLPLEYPATAQPEDFVAAFGGRVESPSEFYESLGCVRPA